MQSYLHLPHSHALLREHSQRGVHPPRPHHVHRQAAVFKLFFWLQERVSIQPDVSLRNIKNMQVLRLHFKKGGGKKPKQ